MINTVIAVCLLILLIIADQLTKCYFHQRYLDGDPDIVVIKNFFTFSTVFNEGAAFSFLNDKAWAQTFFKILTIVALVALYIYFMFIGRKYSFLTYGVMCLFAGIIGNFIDRLVLGKVVDFISFQFGSYTFPTFNIADIAITVGVIILVIHYLFIDDEALFRKKKKTEDIKDEKDV